MSVRAGDSSPIPLEVLEASMKTYEAEQARMPEQGWPASAGATPASNPAAKIPEKTPSQHPALASGFLNPVVPPTPMEGGSTPIPRQTPVPPTQQNSPRVAPPQIPSAVPSPIPPMVPLQVPQTLPPMPPPPPVIPFEIIQTIESLKQANFNLQEKLETAMGKIERLDKDKSDLLDRLEKTLLIAAKLKDVESDRNQVREKLSQTESELRNLFNRNVDLENELRDRTSCLSSVRAKYFAERDVNEKLGEELRVVSTVTEIAKNEVENQISRNNLRQMQLSTARNLAGSSQVLPQIDDELQMAKSIYENALLKTSMGSSLKSGPIPDGPFPMPNYTQWRDVCQRVVTRDEKNFDVEIIRSSILSSSQSRMENVIYDDNTIRVRMEASVENSDSATLKFTILNIAPYIVQSVRLVAANFSSKNSTTSQICLDFIDPVFLRPGQTVTVSGSFEASLNSTTLPSICLSYAGSGGIPTNKYIRVPMSVTKFFTPMRPSVSVVVDRWTHMAENEVQKTFFVHRDEFKSLSEIVIAGELGGNFSSVRAVDMNPRGCVFVAAWGAGKHGPVREIITRIELGSADWPGPLMCRVTVRSSLITLSKAVSEMLLTVLS